MNETQENVQCIPTVAGVGAKMAQMQDYAKNHVSKMQAILSILNQAAYDPKWHIAEPDAKQFLDKVIAICKEHL